MGQTAAHPAVHAFLAHPSMLMALVGFVALLAPLVLIHEAGHYLVARACGVMPSASSGCEAPFMSPTNCT